MTRKLIKPSLSDIAKYQKKDNKKKVTPQFRTNAENYYYKKQMDAKTHMILNLVDGEIIKGIIEWYDEKCVKVKCEDGRNLIIFKHFIKYFQKDPDYNYEEVDVDESDLIDT